MSVGASRYFEFANMCPSRRADGGTQRTDGAKGTAVFHEQHLKNMHSKILLDCKTRLWKLPKDI